MDGLDRLSAAIDGFEADGWESADLPRTLLQLHRLTDRMQGLLLRATAEFDAGGAWSDDGALTPAAWLRANARLTAPTARRQLRDARLLRDALPGTAAALAAGEVSREHVSVITTAAEATPGRVATLAEAEPLLVDAARRLDPLGLRRVVERWACAVDPVGAVVDEQDRHSRRRLSLSHGLDGMLLLNGQLDPESGATVLAAIEALSAPAGTPATDRRTPGQRRADALVAIARAGLDTAPRRNGRRPALTVTVDVEVLRKRMGAAELAEVGPLSASAALRLACDAELTPVLLRDRRPLDVGRTRRTVPPRLRRAVGLRDGGCRFAGCDRPESWCDAHHVVPWSAGGATDLANLALVCEPHHRAIHEGGFTLHLAADGTVTTRHPDGRLIADPQRSQPP